jgi:hypothetical protein
MTDYPSISAGALGQLLGSLYESIPVRICGPKLSHLLFALPTAPIGALLYLLTKVFGQRFVLTNRSVQIWSARGNRKISSASLDDIAAVELDQSTGQKFYRAADIKLKGANGQTLLRLKGVGDAASFGNAIRNAIQARQQVKAAMATIEARG